MLLSRLVVLRLGSGWDNALVNRQADYAATSHGLFIHRL